MYMILGTLQFANIHCGHNYVKTRFLSPIAGRNVIWYTWSKGSADNLRLNAKIYIASALAI